MRRLRGLAIVECLIALTILSVTMLVTCYALTAGQQHIYYGNRIATAVRLGRDLIEEITSRDYRDRSGSATLGPETGETSRADFDDVDDYQNFSDGPDTLTNAAGTPYPAADQVFKRKVTITKGNQNVSDLGRTFSGLTVKVTVQGPGGEQWTFTRFIPEPGQ